MIEENLRIQLGIDDYLKLIKEDKNLCMSYVSFSQYMNVLEKENQQLKQKLDNVINYAKQRCNGYIEDEECDCEYCDGVFASCRKILQLAGENIKKYER